MTEFVDLTTAVDRHVRPGDTVHVVMGHSRWTAAARELARQYWGSDAGFTLVMFSLSSLGALFFRGGMLDRVVTAYSGDAFPTYSPNPVFQRAYTSGEVAVEHWSFLALQQRLEAAARGLPAMVTRSLAGSSMAENAAYHDVATPAGAVGLVEPLVPDVALVHGAVADRAGNVALAPPLLEGVAGAWAARRGTVVTVERVVDDLRPWSHLVAIPAHRVAAVVEAPFGAHPGGLAAPHLPVASYGEDIPFWIEARDACRGDVDGWARTWCLDLATHEAYLDRLGQDRLSRLEGRAEPDSWRDDDAEQPVEADAPVTAWERSAAWCADALADRIADVGADAVLAGAGVANLAAWVAVGRARDRGHAVHLTAELGLWDYEPTPADPFIFNLRAFPSAAMLTDASHVLGTVVGGPGTTTIACVGAAQVDRTGNLNSTLVPGGPFLVGSGGGNDAVTTADDVVVVTLMASPRTVERVGFITAPGDRVRTVVTDRGVLRKRGDELRLAAVPPGDGSVEDRVREAVDACGWDLAVDREVTELPEVDRRTVLALRNYDRRRWFLA